MDSHHDEERRFVKARCLAVSRERFQRAIEAEKEGDHQTASWWLKKAIEAEEDVMERWWRSARRRARRGFGL